LPWFNPGFREDDDRDYEDGETVKVFHSNQSDSDGGKRTSSCRFIAVGQLKYKRSASAINALGEYSSYKIYASLNVITRCR
jgi:hypothetical protein